MTTETLTLGPLTFVCIQAGPLVDVVITDQHGLAVGEMQMSVATWQSLRATADLLATADRRAEEQRVEIERLKRVTALAHTASEQGKESK